MKILRLLFILYFLVITLFGQPVFAGGPNLIQNPSLENFSGNTPSQWSRISWGNVSATFSYPVTGHTGIGAEVALASNSSGDSRWAHTPVTVEPGVVYEYTNWYKSTVESAVNIKYISSSGSVSWGWIATLPSTNNTWKQITSNVTIPPGITSVVVFHLIVRQGSLTVDDFSLAKKDGTTPSVPPVPQPPSNGFSEGMVTFSFDDAWLTPYINALPILESAGIKGTFYITTGRVIDGVKTYMTPGQIVDLAAKGHEIGGHTITHPDLTTLSRKDLDTELTVPRSYLQKLTGQMVSTLAYPFGAFNSQVKSRTSMAGYTNARSAGTTIEYGFNSAMQDKFEIRSFSPTNTVSLASMKGAIDRAKANKEWFVFSFHRVENNAGDYLTTVDDFKALTEYTKEIGIKTVTMKEGAALLK